MRIGDVFHNKNNGLHCQVILVKGDWAWVEWPGSLHLETIRIKTLQDPTVYTLVSSSI